MAPDVDATAGTPKGWHDLEAILAEGPVAALLATYLVRAGKAQDRRVSRMPSQTRFSVLRRPSRGHSTQLCSRRESLISVGERSGQMRSYVRPVARRL